MNEQTSPEAKAAPQPASTYIDAELYTWLDAASEDFRAFDPGRIAEIDGVHSLLASEARALDDQAFRPWLDLYVADCVYWVPSNWPASSAALTVSLEFHDRRRLIDRVDRLGTGLAYSQLPPSRTARVLGVPEIWKHEDGRGHIRARAPFVMGETRAGENRVLSGWNGYILRQTDEGLRIVVKQVNLIDADEPQGNNSFFL